MQYEFPHFRLDRVDFLKGGNSYENYPDGGIVTSSFGYNAFTKPGWLSNAPSQGNIVTASLPTGVGISFGLGKGTISQKVMAVGVNDSQDGYFYTMSESTGDLTLVGSADTAHDYQLGFTDTVFYKGAFYTTSKDDICYQLYDLTSRDVSWWVTTKGKSSLNSFSPHPQVVYGDIHYIADGRYIHQNDNGTVSTQVLDLGSDWVITEMVVYNNLIYIAAEPYYNYSAVSHGLAKIFTWDGYSDSFIDEYAVNHRISAMYVFKNVLYVWTAKYMGYFTGSTIKNLYPVSKQIYRSQITETSDSMYFADNTTIVRYGSPYLTGQFRFHRWQQAAAAVNGICSPATEALFICTTGASNGGNYMIANVNGAGSGALTFKFNKRIFPRPVKVRGYVINVEGIATGQYVDCGYIDHTGTLRANKRFGYSTGNTAMQGKSTWRFDVSGTIATNKIDPYITLGGDVYLQSIDVLYEASESKLNN